MQITEFWDWDAAFGLQIWVTPISCVSLVASTFPSCLLSLHNLAVEHFPLYLGMGCCIVLPQPRQCGFLLFLLLSLLFKGGGLTKAGQLLRVSPALQGWVVEVDWGRSSSTNPQAPR